MLFSANRTGIAYKYLLIGLASMLIIFSIVIYMRSLGASKRVVEEERFVQGVDSSTIYFFRANWCGHCQRFKPTWDKFVDRCTTSEEHHNIELVELDVDKEDSKPLMRKYNVSGFPTVILVNNKTHEFKRFQDDRTEEALMRFVS